MIFFFLLLQGTRKKIPESFAAIYFSGRGARRTGGKTERRDKNTKEREREREIEETELKREREEERKKKREKGLVLSNTYMFF